MKIITGINDIATTNPDLVQYFSNVEDAFKYSAGSGIKTHMHCPNCGYKKDMIISNLTQFGFSCPYCSDGISYPEKFMIGILEQLQLKYDRQITYDNHIHKYDFFVNGIIIETHGEQHYRNTQWATYDKQHEIDMYKYDLAVLNGHEFNKTYIVIDSRHSSVSWMKENVMSSELPNLLNFKEEDIDWIKIGKQIEKSLVKEICEYYKKYGGTPQELAKKFPVCRRTIGRYLKKGHELGWCQYNVKQGQRTDIEREAI